MTPTGLEHLTNCVTSLAYASEPSSWRPVVATGLTVIPSSTCPSSLRNRSCSGSVRQCAGCQRSSLRTTAQTRLGGGRSGCYAASHDDDAVDDELVWGIVSRHAVQLRHWVQALLADGD